MAEQATPEEIRDAFRALARMMHPDQQTDPHLKEIAERQMRRLNRIYSVLSDPERRRRYDELADSVRPPVIVHAEPVIVESPIGSRTVWIGAVVIGLAFLGLFWWGSANLQQSHAREVVHEVARDARMPAADSYQDSRSGYESSITRTDPREVARLRADLHAMQLERDAAIRELDSLRNARSAHSEAGVAGPVAVKSPTPSALSAAPELPTVARPTALPARTASLAVPPAPYSASGVPRSERTSPAGLAGFWFYVKPAMGQENKNQDLYPPEFIEATIVEENGVIKGKYRSRFQIVDRAISPDVSFTFHGPAGSAGPFSWIGPGGARGEVTVKLASENQLRVEWNATELGSQQGLVSGTAVLKRRIE